MASIAPIDIPRLKSASESLNFSGRKEPDNGVIYQRLVSTKPLEGIDLHPLFTYHTHTIITRSRLQTAFEYYAVGQNFLKKNLESKEMDFKKG
jgi:hypothetical protein